MSDDLWDQPFAYPLSSGATETETPLELDPEAKAKVDAALDDIDECRARAAVSARSYVVWR